jgi:hypothetical protein
MAPCANTNGIPLIVDCHKKIRSHTYFWDLSFDGKKKSFIMSIQYRVLRID